MMELKVLALVLLGPLAAAYDFVTNPAAPPQIFAAQFNEAFPNHQISPTPLKPAKVHKKVYVTHG
jgi:hypothetical protein